MSVRATERLIGDLVAVSALPNGPQMVVQAIEEETKIVVTSWFSDHNEYQEGYFPAKALDRVEPEKAKKTTKPKSGKK
ncbi:MAG: hypothetical protein FWG99_05520 [Treponema sp.]|nr:hypothetical protein [Treponema sp.]